MPRQKQKQFLLPKKSNKHKGPEEPRTANEFLQAAGDFEESGEKWRAGDTAKSFRAFSRAIETYENGLRNFPDDFDLAYNRARLQYSVAQQPRLLVHLSTPVPELLRTALESHRNALRLDQDNADLLFNTAQVLASLAESLSEDKRASNESLNQSLNFLRESLELFQRCLNIQESQFKQSKDAYQTSNTSQTESATAEEASSEMDVDKEPDASESEEETWASVVEPVTMDSIFDTIEGQLDTLTAICSLQPEQASWVEEHFQTFLQSKLSDYNGSTDRQKDLDFALAKFRSQLANASFRSKRMDISNYVREVDDAFQAVELDPQRLCDKVEAQFSLATAVRLQHASDNTTDISEEDLKTLNKLLWNHATNALNSLTEATKLLPTARNPFNTLGSSRPSDQNIPRIHLQRGDCEVFRLSLRDPPTKYTLAAKSTDTLLGNAALYYRMAGRQASAEGESAKDEAEEAYMKELIVEMIGAEEGRAKGLEGASRGTKVAVRETIEEMREEGILGDETAAKLVKSLGG